MAHTCGHGRDRETSAGAEPTQSQRPYRRAVGNDRQRQAAAAPAGTLPRTALGCRGCCDFAQDGRPAATPSSLAQRGDDQVWHSWVPDDRDCPPARCCCCITDGLVKTCATDIDAEINALSAALAVMNPNATPDEVCDGLLSAMARPGQHDDIALLALRVDRPTEP